MKKKVVLTIMVALSVAIAGCGSKGETTESQKEVTIKDTDNEKAENQKKKSEKNTKKSQESGSKKEEIIVKEDEKAVSQQTVLTDNNSSDTNTSSNNTTSDNDSVNASENSNSGSTSSESTSSGGSSSGGSSNSSNGNLTPAPTSTPELVHTHTWVHVDATGHYETVTIQAAYDEQVPVYEEKEFSICNVCGADITGNTTEHTKNHALAYEGGGYHSEWRQVQTGTQTIHHEAVTENRWKEDTPAYDVCSGCGLTK